jgi:propionyl-CoA carboxylase alpha chain
MITGIDLVEQMIRVAAGERLSIGQQDVRLTGWAVESRIYAEDPTRNFLPSIGRLSTYRPPAEGADGDATVRNDTGVEEGGEISIHYDPMIAKLVTHARSRIEAIDAQARALDGFAIEGIRHNIPFLATLMSQERWREGRLSTGYIAEEFPEGFKPPQPAGDVARRLAIVAADIDHRFNCRKRAISGQMRAARPVAFDLERVVMLGSEAHEARIEAARGGIVVHLDGGPVHVESDWRPGDPVWRGSVDGIAIAVQARIIPNGIRLAHGGAETDARVYTRREADLARLMPEKKSADTSKALLCPMPGLVRNIAVNAGQEVKAGETLAIVEAMKMENVLRAERDVTVKALRAKAGDSLAVDAVIMEFV